MLLIIESLANQDYQKRVWIEGKGPEVDSFDDTICDYNDFVTEVLSEAGLYGLTEAQEGALRSLSTVFKDFYKNGLGNCYMYQPQHFINSIEWRKVSEQATRVLKVFGYLAGDRYIHCREYSFEVKKQLLKSFLDAIACMTTADTNAKIWQKEERYKDNFGSIYSLFQAEIDTYLDNPQEFGIDFKQIEKLKKLKEALYSFAESSDFKVDPETFIHTAECKMIAAAARELMEVFKRS